MNATATTMITAEDAPIGVQVWPTISPRYAPNFTIAAVEIVTRKLRDTSGTYETSQVIWTYENGNTRTFDLGERVACEIC